MIRRTARLLAALSSLLPAACGPAFWPPGAPPDWPRLAFAIVGHYEDRAAERWGTCRLPQITGFLRVEVRERTAERLVLRVRYAWHDEGYGDEDGVFLDRCRGFGARTFVLDPGSGRVLAMSGPKRNGP